MSRIPDHPKHWSIFPLGEDGRPLTDWEPFKKRRPTEEQLRKWAWREPAGWAVVLGKLSGFITLVFRGECGLKTWNELALPAHVVTDEAVITFIQRPGWPAPGVDLVGPGLQLRGDDEYVIFAGRTEEGEYAIEEDSAPLPASAPPPELSERLGLAYPPDGSAGPDYFSRSTELPPEIIEGVLRERQLAVLGGAYGVGKSPLLADLVVCTVHGLSWCGRVLKPRPVIHFDFETPGQVYRRNVNNIARRRGVTTPVLGDDLELFLLHDDGGTASHKSLVDVLEEPIGTRLELLRARLKAKPNALVVVDPVELLSDFDKLKTKEILELYKSLRSLLAEFPTAAMILTFNLRKSDNRRQRKANLLEDARDWLSEVAGSNDIMNRSDVRLGMDFYDDDLRVVNGVRRGEETMHPLIVRSVGDSPDELAGFELVRPEEVDLRCALTKTQREHWASLPDEFRFEEGAKFVPRSSLHRLIARAKSLGLLEHDGVFYRKRSGA